MSYDARRDLTTEQALLHADLQKWAFTGKFEAGSPHRGDGGSEGGETPLSDALCARFCDRLDSIVGSSLFDLVAFRNHVNYLFRANFTSGDNSTRSGNLRRRSWRSTSRYFRTTTTNTNTDETAVGCERYERCERRVRDSLIRC